MLGHQLPSPSARRLSGTVALVAAALLALGLVPVRAVPGARAGAAPGLLTSRPRPARPAARRLAVGAEVRTQAGQRRRLTLPDGTALYLNEKTAATLTADRRLTLAAGEVFLDVAPGKGPFVVRTPRREVTARGTRFAVRADDKGTGVLVATGRVQVTGLDAPLTAGQQLAPGGTRPSPAPRASHRLAWAYDLVAAAETPLVPPSRHAGGRLVALDPDGRPADLALRKYHIDVHVEDGFARTTIDQTYFNHSPARLEGTFYFPLPPDASLSRLAMYVDGTLMEGGMAERDYARTVYESIVYQQKDPALLEWVDGSTFKMRVFPLEGRQEKRIILSYTQRLPTLYGQLSYRFPAGHSLGAVRDWSFHARLKGGSGLAWNSPSHTLRGRKDGADLLLDAAARDVRLDRDVVLTLADGAGAGAESVRFASAEQEGAGYLMLRYRPALAGPRERRRRDWVFQVETSGDRDPLLARAQVEVVRALLTGADPGDTFAVLAANTRTRALAREALPVTPDNVASAVAFLEGAHLVGALDLGRALADAKPFLQSAKEPYLVHVGSGVPALGERRQDVLVRGVPGGTRYVGVGVGKRWNRSLMKAAAERTGGYFTQINPDEVISWRGFELACTLDTPRLLDVRVEDRAKRVTFLPFARSLAQGEELAAVARLAPGDKALPEAVIVRGTLDGRAFERELPVRDVAPKADYLPRTWAGLEIERLLAGGAVKNKQRVVELSKAMYVMTPFTSLLVLENEEMYQQYKVDRGRKDHWAMYACPAKIPVVFEPEDGQVGDPRKGIKPWARQVLKTILVREPPLLLGPVATAGNEPPIEFPATAVWSTRLTLASGQFRLPANGQLPRPGEPTTTLRILNDSSDEGPAERPRDLPIIDAFAAPARPAGDSALPESVAARARELDLSHTDFGRDDPVVSRRSYGLYDSRSSLAFDSASGPIAQLLKAQRANGQLGDLRSAAAYDLNGIGTRLDGAAARRARLRSLSAAGAIDSRVLERIDSSPPSLLYQRPGYSGDDRLFFDLVAYAPGLNTGAADVRAVLEAEAYPDPRGKPGTIDAGARALLDRARPRGWTSLALPAVTISFDGRGRWAWERSLPVGLRERVVCDGQTLLHLYPDLNLAARRAVSRFHRLDLARLVPWALPRAEDLARGADLRLLDDHTVALVPHGAGARGKDGKPLPHVEVHLVFTDGRLAQRRVMEMPARKLLARETYSPEGVVKSFDAAGNELAARKGVLKPADAPDLKPDLGKLVVLPLPYRTREHVLKARQIEKTNYQNLRFADARALLAADFAAGNGSSALQVFQQALHARDQRQLGLYVLLAACGQNLDSEHVDVLAEHLDEPLAQYLALYSSPVLRKHSSQWASGSRQWGEGFLRHLALTHALCQRWQNARALGRGAAQRKAELDRALEYVRRNKGSAFGWALLSLVQDRTREAEERKQDMRDAHRALADAWPLFADVPGLAYAARYEQARSLWKSGDTAGARRHFRELYTRTLREDLLPRIDADFRAALLGDAGAANDWSELLRGTAARLIEKKHRQAVLTLALQCWQVGDEPLANHLLALAGESVPDSERSSVRIAALAFLWETGQLARADAALRQLLDDPKDGKRPALWRLAAKLAGRREMPDRELECLERALELEYRDLPDVINVRQVRAEYEQLLTHYQNLAQAMRTLKVRPPADFRDRVVRAGDRWRALDRGSGQACRLVARTLQTLGDRELAWDYLTTPVALRPGESDPWSDLAQALQRRGESDLADRAFRAACEAEPTNAQLLWDRAQNLRLAGKLTEARKLYRQLAEGTWQPRFNWIQTQARWQMEKR